MKLYLNGSLDNTLDVTGSIDTTANELDLGRSASYGEYMDGTSDDVRIYDRALSQTWISRRFERTKGIFGL